MGKRYNQSDNAKHSQFDDDFEDFGYEVKNIRRQTKKKVTKFKREVNEYCLLYTSPSPRDRQKSRMPSSA